MTVRQVRLVAAWLRHQAEQQEAREAWLDFQRLCLRHRVARQHRDAHGRWARQEANADRAA